MWLLTFSKASISVWRWLTLCRWGFGEDSWSLLARSLVFVRSDSCCTDPTALWTGQAFGLRMIGMLLAFSASSIFPSFASCFCASNSWLAFLTGKCQLSQSEASCRHDSMLLPPVQAVSSAGLCNTFLEHHYYAFLVGTCWWTLLWACMHLPSLWQGQSNAAVPTAIWTLCWAGWLSLKDLFIWHIVFLFDAKDGAQAVLVKPLK